MGRFTLIQAYHQPDVPGIATLLKGTKQKNLHEIRGVNIMPCLEIKAYLSTENMENVL